MLDPEDASGSDWSGLVEFAPRSRVERKAPKIALDAVGPDDVRRVKEGFWEVFTAVRPRFGRLGKLRDFAVNIVRLFEMLVEPGFDLPWRSTAAIVFALAYFISSVDLVPDTIPVIGFVDDALVVAEVMVMVRADVARFESTRRRKRERAGADAAAA